MRLTLDVVRARLERVKVACPPGCGLCCGPAPVGTVEARRAGIEPGLTGIKPDTTECEHLGTDKRCGIYEERPVVCRVMGAFERLPCPIGLRPPGGWIEGRELAALDGWIASRVRNDPPLREAVGFARAALTPIVVPVS